MLNQPGSRRKRRARIPRKVILDLVDCSYCSLQVPDEIIACVVETPASKKKKAPDWERDSEGTEGSLEDFVVSDDSDPEYSEKSDGDSDHDVSNGHGGVIDDGEEIDIEPDGPVVPKGTVMVSHTVSRYLSTILSFTARVRTILVHTPGRCDRFCFWICQSRP